MCLSSNVLTTGLKMFSVLKQMLNCCIERKRARDDARKVLDEGKERAHKESGSSPAAVPSTKEVSPGKSWDSWSDSEEEFFECLSDQGDMDAPQTEEENTGIKRKAEGRLHQYNSMNLLNSSEPLYVPVTQVSICLSAFYCHLLTRLLTQKKSKIVLISLNLILTTTFRLCVTLLVK